MSTKNIKANKIIRDKPHSGFKVSIQIVIAVLSSHFTARQHLTKHVFISYDEHTYSYIRVKAIQARHYTEWKKSMFYLG